MAPHPISRPTRRGLVRPHLMTAAMCAALAACGGGDDGSYDVRAGMQNLMTQPKTWTLSGDAGAARHVLNLVTEPAGTGTYPRTGEAGHRTRQIATLWLGQTAVDQRTTLYHLRAADQLPFGATDEGTRCTDVAMSPSLPTSAGTEESGPLAVVDTWDGCGASAARVSRTVSSWRLVDEGRWTMLCLQSVRVASAGGTLGAIEEQCYEIGRDGGIGTRARATVVMRTADGAETTLSMRNY